MLLFHAQAYAYITHMEENMIFGRFFQLSSKQVLAKEWADASHVGLQLAANTS